MNPTLELQEKTFTTQAIIGPDGSLIIPELALSPFHTGERVTLTISALSIEAETSENPLRGSVLKYEEPFGAAVPLEDWEALE